MLLIVSLVFKTKGGKDRQCISVQKGCLCKKYSLKKICFQATSRHSFVLRFLVLLVIWALVGLLL